MRVTSNGRISWFSLCDARARHALWNQDPDDNADAALSLAARLLARDGVHLQGIGRSGLFTVAVKLTDAGRKRLREAIRNRPESGVFLVSRIGRQRMRTRG